MTRGCVCRGGAGNVRSNGGQAGSGGHRDGAGVEGPQFPASQGALSCARLPTTHPHPCSRWAGASRPHQPAGCTRATPPAGRLAPVFLRDPSPPPLPGGFCSSRPKPPRPHLGSRPPLPHSPLVPPAAHTCLCMCSKPCSAICCSAVSRHVPCFS